MAITIVGLGPGDGRFLTRQAWDLLTSTETIYLRTGRHPAAADLPATVEVKTFDHLYETADSFTVVYQAIVDQLLALAKKTDVVYGVPGHPYVAEVTVTKLLKQAEAQAIPVAIVDGLSFVAPVLAAVGVDALEGVQLFDALEVADYLYPPLNPDRPLLLGQVYNRFIAGEVKLTLTAVYDDEHPVSLIHAAGTTQQIVEHIPLYQIDHSPQIQHLTSLYVPPLPQKAALSTLAETVAVLRSPGGCPWDQKQTPQSMREGLLEEAIEVLEALDSRDSSALCEELGDLLYHLVMQAQMASEMGDFKLTDVIAGIEAKLKYRHPHVWGDWDVANSEEVVRNWETLKQQAKPDEPDSLLDSVPQLLPALAQSQKIQSRVAAVGFDWPNVQGVFAKLAEELNELRAATTDTEKQAELGDLLFVTVNVARWLGIDAESALREANLRFSRRFRQVERLAAERQLDLSQMDPEALDRLWQEAKRKLAKDGTLAKVGGSE